jgi:hypothetical protein
MFIVTYFTIQLIYNVSYKTQLLDTGNMAIHFYNISMHKCFNLFLSSLICTVRNASLIVLCCCTLELFRLNSRY